MNRKSFLCLLLVLAMIVSCLAAVAETEPTPAPEPVEAAQATESTETAEAPETAEAAATPEPVIVEELPADTLLATINGDAVTMADVSMMYNYMKQQYSAYGMDVSDPNMQMALLSYALGNVLQTKLVEQKGAELGLDQFTEEELSAFTEQVNSTMDNVKESYKTYYTDENKTEEENEAAMSAFLEKNGFIPEQLEANFRQSQIYERVYQYAIEGISVKDEDVKAAYDKKIEDEKAAYEADLSAYGSAATSGTPAYYAPEGYRTVKHILITSQNAPEIKELKAKLAEMAGDDAERAEAESKLAELMADIQPKLDEIQTKIEAGEDFQALIDQYGEDGGMKGGASAETGYYVCDATANFVAEFKEGAMALAKVGDISEPVLSDYGFHIIRYNSDVPSGAVPFEEVQEALKTQTQQSAEQEAFANAVNAWAEASEVVYEEIG